MRNPLVFLRRNSDIQIQGSFIILFSTSLNSFSQWETFSTILFFCIHSQGRAYLFYTPFTYIMSLSLRANFKITWISGAVAVLLRECHPSHWDGRNPAVKTLQAMRWPGWLSRLCTDRNRMGPRQNTRGSGRCDWAEKTPPITNARRW